MVLISSINMASMMALRLWTLPGREEVCCFHFLCLLSNAFEQ